MAKGEGKGWAKGHNAASDARVARNAAAHVGLVYVNHLPPGTGRYHRSSRALALEWSDSMAYVVGLTATDGCLFTGLRKINFKSNDRDLVATYLAALGRTNRIKSASTRTGGVVYFTEFGDAALYRWMLGIGLTPRKSLTLGAIDVPNQFLAPLMRGLFEGDGTIQNFTHRPTPTTAPGYTYERLWVYFSSASHAHIDWLRQRSTDLFGVRGYVEARDATEKRHAFYRLKFGKYDSITLLRAMYPRDDVPKLERKWQIWADYKQRHAI